MAAGARAAPPRFPSSPSVTLAAVMVALLGEGKVGGDRVDDNYLARVGRLSSFLRPRPVYPVLLLRLPRVVGLARFQLSRATRVHDPSI